MPAAAEVAPSEPAGAPPATGGDAGNEYSPSLLSEGVPEFGAPEAQQTFAFSASECPPGNPEASTGLPASSPNAASAPAEASLPPAEENSHVAEQDAEPATEQGEPASSSSANPPLQDADSEEVVPTSSKQVPHTKGVPRTKVYSTPVEVLSAMLPPGCRIVLNHNDLRFTSTWVGETAGVPLDLRGKSFQDLL